MTENNSVSRYENKKKNERYNIVWFLLMKNSFLAKIPIYTFGFTSFRILIRAKNKIKKKEESLRFLVFVFPIRNYSISFDWFC